MRVSKLFGKTVREEPGGTELESHRLMLKAGMIHQSASGVYSYLPLAWRSLRKIEQIIREEIDAVGGQEVRLSVLQPRELWEQSGRDAEFGSGLFRLQDRRDRDLVMAPTHEELLTTIVNANVNSYRDLPLIIYQIQTKFRDEQRPRGGLLRVREFDMKDAYSFDTDEESLDNSYQAMVQAYKNIYARCGLPAIMVEADSGAIGGKDSQEFILLADSGEDTVVMCSSCDYASNLEKAVFKKPSVDLVGAPEDLEEAHTPGVKTIEDLAEFLNIPTSKTLKAVFYMADGEIVIVAIRGDLEVNEIKLTNALSAQELQMATPEEVRNAGLVAGSASPVGLEGIKTVADDSINLGSNFVVGANRKEYHLRNANHPRDFQPDVTTDIALAQEGDICLKCNASLETRRGIEVGHVFKLGTRYSEVLGASFQNAEGEQLPIIMGCYGIGVGRLLAGAIEQHHDEKGMVLASPIAPYQVSLIGMNVEQQAVSETAGKLYEELTSMGFEVLYDDREESAGVKFNDADLLGLPLRLVVSPRNLKQNVVEFKGRMDSQAEMVPLESASARVKELLSG